MRYLSVCSGIEAATVAWHPLGWEPAAFSEIEPFPRAVLAHHYPDVPCHGDFTTIGADEYDAIDLLVGGTPCQSFSVAGLRGGLGDDRGNLALEYLRLADRKRPRWLVWENVPGVLSSNGGRDFGAILGGMVELGYGIAYRVLDAQHFGVPQRRRRVFVVGHLGDWRRAAAVLFERHSLSGHPAPRREAGQGIANAITERPDRGGGNSEGQRLIPSTGETSHCLNADGMGRQDYETETLIAHSLRAEGFDASEDGTGRGTPIIPIDMRQASRGATMTNNRAEGSSGGAPGTGIGDDGDPSPTVSTSHPPAVCFTAKDHGADASDAVRRLTPRECERLQGFPEAQKSYTILLCQDLSDQQKANALAELQCRKLQSNAWAADGGGWMLSAEAAAHHSSTSLADPAPPVAVDVLIDLERQQAQLHSAARSMSSAASAGERSAFPLPTGITSFAQLAALLTHGWVLAMQDGRAASQASTTPSTHRLSGSSIAIPFGLGTEGHAAGVAAAIETAIRFSTFTTLPSGADTESLRSTLETLCSCVAHAIAGFIPEQTAKASCFAVRLTTSQGYTAVPYRGKPASDGPRYKALGSSMAVPCMRWIGERIQVVEAIDARAAAA